jgi:CheY-like chemotaxis protein
MTNEEFIEHLRRALHHLYEPDRLRQSPLASLFAIADRLDTFSALQRILVDAIESLEPQADEPPESRAWEIYEPLYYRYVQQLSQQQVAKQLGMSVRHLRRKEHAALEVLAGHLWAQFDLQAKLRQGTSEDTTAPSQDSATSPTVSEELAWLKEAPLESPAELNSMLPDILGLIQPLVDQHRIRLDVTIADDLPRLAVHSVALSQTLLNLLTVAIHRAPDGQVSISAEAVSQQIEIKIEGASSPSGLPHTTKNDDASADLARQLTELCGGRLTFSGTDDRFSVTLALPAIERLPVLVVDDNADTLQLLRRYTAGTRYRLITVRDPEQASSLAEKTLPKIIVLDVMMPGIDGWKVLARLRQNLLTERTPIVVCTILPQREMALALGANGFVRKPVTRQAFLAALDHQVELMEKGSC